MHSIQRRISAARQVAVVAAVAACAIVAPVDAAAPGLGEALAVLRTVGAQGKGNDAARQAWQGLSKADADALPRVLAALDGADPLGANWIRAAVDAIAERTLSDGGKLPADALEAFVRDRSHNPRGRRLAFEWLTRVDTTAADRLIPTMLHDPSIEFRHDAVARLLDEADPHFDADRKDDARALYRKALSGALDPKQVKRIVERLGKLGETVGLPRHYGFVMDWKVIGPFDNRETKGFDAVYPPENELRFDAAYKGKDGEVKWIDAPTDDDYGVLDLNKVLSEQKGVLAYVLADFTSEREQPVVLRLGAISAVKVWLNGELVFGHHEYHHGMEMDQYRAKATMRAGRNRILVKVCQNEQTDDWARVWQFQLRVCDATGNAILSTTRPADGKAKEVTR